MILQPPALTSYATQYSDTTRYTPLTVTLHLDSPLVSYEPLHLDGLLAWCVVQEATHGAGLPPSPLAYELPLPLACLWRSTDGLPLWAATPLRPVGVQADDIAYWHKRFQPGRWTRTPSGRWAIPSTKGRFMERRTPMPTAVATAWAATACGDPAEIARLLAPLRHIGKKRSQGFGAVARWEIAPAPALALIAAGQLTRPVPAAAGLLDRAPEEPPAPLGWTPPHWLPALWLPGWPTGTSVA